MEPKHVSAGGVVLNKKGDILLLHRFKSPKWEYDSWHLPKGTLISNETIEKAALREIEEETGYKVKILDYLGFLNSTFEREGQLIHKRTHYFIMMPISNSGRHDTEHDEIKWVSFDEAEKKLRLFPIWEKEGNILKVAEKWSNKQAHSEEKPK